MAIRRDEIMQYSSFDTGNLFQLIRSAVAIRETGMPPGIQVPSTGVSDQVVFDLDVDGARYILVKTQQERGMSTMTAQPPLSPREREIVRMVAQGHPNKVIAGALNISSWTVNTHLRRVFTKLGVSSRAAMVAKVSRFEFALSAGFRPVVPG